MEKSAINMTLFLLLEGTNFFALVWLFQLVFF